MSKRIKKLQPTGPSQNTLTKALRMVIYYEFLNGMTMGQVAFKWEVSQKLAEEIIREVALNAEAHASARKEPIA